MEFFADIDLESLLQTYGYWAIFLGTFLEGETIVILAGILVMSGHLSFLPVAMCAFIGSSLSDQLMFSLGKYKGVAVLARFPRLNKKMDKVTPLLKKYDTYLILGFRFVYGIRNITPLALGMSNLSHKRFLLWNLLGASVWAFSFTAAGYYCGRIMIKIVEVCGLSLFFVILGVGAIAGIVFFIIKRRKARQKTSQAAVANSNSNPA